MNTFSLYSEHPLKEEAEREGMQIIERFICDFARWRDAYSNAGAHDTAALEAFGEEVIRKLDNEHRH